MPVKKMTDTEMYELYIEAHTAGMKAGSNSNPTPMIVGTPSNPLGNNIDYSKPTYYVNEGVCGFAWVTIKPGNSQFANFLKNRKVARKAYGGGVSVWVNEFGQSMERKQAYARAFANILAEKGIKAYAGSRME